MPAERRVREIRASSRRPGSPRWASSVAAACRKIRDGELYLIRRHGCYFRPEGHGYTHHLAAAGVFDAEFARQHLAVEGVSAVPLRAMQRHIQAEIGEAQAAIAKLCLLLARLSDPGCMPPACSAL